jgi:8-oxo-dGTP diphosphatase
MKKVRYVLGIQFSASGGSVVLIKKRRPDWQAGYFNAVGGHIEPGETPEAALRREFEEETGVNQATVCWRPLCVLFPNDYVELHVFKSFTVQAEQVKTVTDEEVGLYRLPLDTTVVDKVVYNVPALISLALMD